MLHQTNITAGDFNSTVSQQWFSRPKDQTFDSLESLHTFTEERRRASDPVVNWNTQDICDGITGELTGEMLDQFGGLKNTRGTVTVETPDSGAVAPSNWAFGQLSALSGSPAGFLRSLPAPIAVDCLKFGLKYNRERDLVAGLVRDGKKLAAVTGPKYGRIWNNEVVRGIRDANDRANGAFQIPGLIDWAAGPADNGTYTYDSEAKGDSTLFASDRDMFVFLIAHNNPIEIGKLADGSPDIVFRGFYAWNSEEGNTSAGVAAFYLRGVCQNRCLWGVENFHEISIRHTSFAPDRFAEELKPALDSFVDGRESNLQQAVEEAKRAVVAESDADMLEYLNGSGGLSRKRSLEAIELHEEMEGHKPTSLWDMSQAITAVARDIPNTDQRLAVEKQAGKILDRVKVLDKPKAFVTV